MQYMGKYLTGLLAACLLAVGCSKHVGFDTAYILKAWNQPVSGGELEPLSDVMLYGYVADTVQWTVASYEDALACRLTDKRSGETVDTPYAAGTPYELEGFGPTLAMRTDAELLMVVVVDRTNRLYGYTMQSFSQNMPEMYVSLVFQPWKKSNAFKNGTWWMFNDFYIPDVVCRLNPSVQSEEGGATTSLRGVTLFAYQVDDPSQWEPDSFADAAGGQLTNTVTGERTVSKYSASGDSAGVVTLNMQPGDYLLVAVDSQNRSYALRPYANVAGAEPLTILFTPWRTDSPFTEGEWKIWNSAPVEPEQPEEPGTGGDKGGPTDE